MLTYCPNCGGELEQDAVFCPNCGANASKATESTKATTENVKVLGNSIDKNIFFGIAWIGFCIPVIALIAWILNLVVLCSDKDKLTLEEKRSGVTMLIILVINMIIATIHTILGFIPYLRIILNLLILPVTLSIAICFTVIGIISAVQAFRGKVFKAPLLYQIASAIIQ